MDLVLAGNDFAQVLFDERRVERILIRRLDDFLSTVLIDVRLGIKGFQVADATKHEQPDDVLGFRREVRLAIGWSPDAGRTGGAHAVTLEHRS